ncbi:hypothetical protein MFM001_21720 [Mycobacterium sp. MFM001]|uniref:hypothetical protein n=1 Tax=Mycobacterium sp. MFM001 TaxID=2049453 RepID=UPI000DA509BE|nr:hypothetical protein [Mycobacterium sp. MFM001]GBE65710.1 hypothetical protein MFM001_21720 [Mycobacterium sp. MFM001]
MTFSSRPGWWRSAIAIVVAAGALVAVLGYGLVRFEFAASAPPPSELVSLVADDVERAETDDGSTPITQKAFEAVALHRALPPRLRSMPLLRWFSEAIPVPAGWSRLGAAARGAPPTSLAGQQLLTQFCIARR